MGGVENRASVDQQEVLIAVAAPDVESRRELADRLDAGLHGHAPHNVDLTHQGGKIFDLAEFHAYDAHLGTRNIGKLAGDGHLADIEALLKNLKLGIAVFDEPYFLENRLVSQIGELQMMFPGGEFQGKKAMPVRGSPFVAAGL